VTACEFIILGEDYPLWSPFDATDAAVTLLQYLFDEANPPAASASTIVFLLDELSRGKSINAKT
jgi:hypothetical protein